MLIARAKPPNYDAIAAAFPAIIGRKGVIFCYGNTIYNPDNETISSALIAHENVHRLQQGEDIEGWWRKYMDDPKFRFEQELPAHKAEYAEYIADPRVGRVNRRLYLTHLARRISGDLYGKMISLDRARACIKDGTADVRHS